MGADDVAANQYAYYPDVQAEQTGYQQQDRRKDARGHRAKPEVDSHSGEFESRAGRTQRGNNRPERRNQRAESNKIARPQRSRSESISPEKPRRQEKRPRRPANNQRTAETVQFRQEAAPVFNPEQFSQFGWLNGTEKPSLFSGFGPHLVRVTGSGDGDGRRYKGGRGKVAGLFT